ncbi:MAG: hypothetical protein R6U26_00190 [Candidatus Undinarchaeales archaeon]
MNKKILLLAISAVFLFSLAPSINAQEAPEDLSCAVYFTGIGCPHCAKSDPYLLDELLEEKSNFIVIEYEVYQQRVNGQIMYDYEETYGTGFGIPLLIFDKNTTLTGDVPIIENTEKLIEENSGSKCLFPEGEKSFDELDLTELPGAPKLWYQNRLVSLPVNKENVSSELVKEFLFSENPEEIVKKYTDEIAPGGSAPISSSKISFNQAAQINNTYFLFGETEKEVQEETESEKEGTDPGVHKELTFAGILSLAVVDAVNPCALAVLSLMLIAIITYNPKKKKNILLAGLAFVFSVFVMYLFYGLVIVRFFQVVQALTSVRLILYKILGAVAIILGFLNVKDFIKYTPGSLGTEMPMNLRPKVKKIISGITSPRGAFLVGAFVTVFLLPCTIGPYVIAGGLLSKLEIIKTIPWLLFYNIIFVLPMIGITLFVYLGLGQVEDVKGWKENNIRYLHLIAGIIMILLGIAMIAGWV